ncbi:DUF3290 family protein [Apilactobacillus micheneri]|uniref:DUF3290 family protein n=1 Tax=Apilactobacillus micheneri TaxID=1899430 RepID=UPI0015E84EEF|nr:DUF3290 family protein [Apilactobacillus micheneri]TPR50123.1 DUF3290 family protein [Apilactobacillus micheneri]
MTNFINTGDFLDFYSYHYLTHPNTFIYYILLVLALIVGGFIIFNGFKYMRDRTNLKYRDMFIMLILFAVLAISLLFANILQQNNSNSQNSQTVKMVQTISKNMKVPKSKIYTSSTQLTNGMTILINKKYYEANFNSTFNNYNLTKSGAIDNNVNIHNDAQLNLGPINQQYLTIFFKLLIGFVMLVIQINLSGKGNLAPSNAVDQLQNYVLGGIIGGMIYSESVTTLQFFIVLLIWSLIIFVSRILIRQSQFFKKLLAGEPKNIIKNGFINVDTALRNGLSASDLAFKLRTQGVHNFKDVQSAVLEQNGQLTVNTFGDESMSYPVITDGSVNMDVLERMGHSEEWINDLVKDSNKEISQIFLGQYVDDHLIIISYPTKPRRPWYYELGAQMSNFNSNHNLTPDRIKRSKSMKKLKEFSQRRHHESNNDKNNQQSEKKTPNHRNRK